MILRKSFLSSIRLHDPRTLGNGMDAEPLIERILNDEGLTGDLPEQEAELLIKWLVTRAEMLAKTEKLLPTAQKRLEEVCRNARGAVQVFVAGMAKQDPSKIAQQLGLLWKRGDTLASLLAQLERSR